MARRQTVYRTVSAIRAEHPSTRIEVLYDPQGGWGGTASLAALPESQWREYLVDCVTWYGSGYCIIEAS